MTSCYNIIVQEYPIARTSEHSGDILRQGTIPTRILENQEYWIEAYWNIRSKEVRMSEAEATTNLFEILDYHNLRSSDWVLPSGESRPFKAVSGKIGSICAKQLEKIYKIHERIDNRKPIFLSDYKDFLPSETRASEPESSPWDRRSARAFAYRGITTDSSLHSHQFVVDLYGNGWALEVAHPSNENVKHKHRVVNWPVQEAQSSCYPDCVELHGVVGAPPHRHLIIKQSEE